MDFLFYLYATVTITFELVMNIEQSIQAQEHILIKSELYTLLTLAIGEKIVDYLLQSQTKSFYSIIKYQFGLNSKA